MNLLDVVLQGVLGDELLLTQAALGDLVVTVLFQYVPPQISHRESLIAELTLDLLPMVGQYVLVQVGHLLAADVAALLELALVLLLALGADLHALLGLHVLPLQLCQDLGVVQVGGEVVQGGVP